MKKKFLIICLFFLSSFSFAQFPLEVGNSWYFETETIDIEYPGEIDSIGCEIVSDTIMENGYKYFRISPSNIFHDFIRADSVGTYHYDTVNNKEWLFYKYDIELGSEIYPNSEHIKVGYEMSNADTSNYMKIYKLEDENWYLFGDSTRVITYYCDTGLDDTYSVSISPQYGFVRKNITFISYYNMSLIGCEISDNKYGTLTSVKEEKVIPDGFKLYQNYPNPFNPVTKIEFKLAEKVFTELNVYDIQGRLVEKLVSGSLNPGIHSVRWNAEDLSSGVYFYRLTAGDYSECKKLILLE